MFERNRPSADAWGQTARLFAFDPQVSDEFGESLAIHRNTIAASTIDRDITVESAADRAIVPVTSGGAVHVFTRPYTGSDAWTFDGPMVTAGENAQDHADFGRSLAVLDDRIVVGSCEYDLDPSNPSEEGTAFVFRPDPGGGWQQVAMLTASNAQDGGEFGFALDDADGTIAVGAFYQNGSSTEFDPGDRPGAAYVYDHAGLGFYIAGRASLPEHTHPPREDAGDLLDSGREDGR